MMPFAALMRTECPACQTSYDVPDAAFRGRARTLHCAVCETTWSAGPPEPVADPGPVVPSEPGLAPEPGPAGPARPDGAEDVDDRFRALLENTRKANGGAPEPGTPLGLEAGPRRASHSRAQGSSAWGISLLLLLLIVILIIALRAPIMHAWPPSIRLYTALGLAKSGM
jgi:predicted Zn finger-like uncharacterized protein